MGEEEWTGWEPYGTECDWGWKEVPGEVWWMSFGCSLEQTSQSEIAALGRFIKDRASHHERGGERDLK